MTDILIDYEIYKFDEQKQFLLSSYVDDNIQNLMSIDGQITLTLNSGSFVFHSSPLLSLLELKSWCVAVLDRDQAVYPINIDFEPEFIAYKVDKSVSIHRTSLNNLPIEKNPKLHEMDIFEISKLKEKLEAEIDKIITAAKSV